MTSERESKGLHEIQMIVHTPLCLVKYPVMIGATIPAMEPTVLESPMIIDT